jgi:hypothetical protein
LKLKFKIFWAGLCFWAFALALNTPFAWANPWEELGPDQTLYQRVKKLEVYGLLDSQDKEVLDHGKYVTRLELAFYTEKAKARISAPEFALPTPTPQVSVPPPVSLPVFATPTMSVPSLPPNNPVVPALPTPVISDALKKEIDDLLKQLRDEAVYLRTQMALNDTRIQKQEDELDKLNAAQDEVDSIWKKANKSVGMPHFYENTSMRFENFNVTGPLSEGEPALNNAMRMVQQMDIGIYSDMGGKGTLSAGLGVLVPYTNASGIVASGVGTSPVSLYMDNPSATFFLYGDMGKWDTTFAVETYNPSTTLDSFSRGFATYAIKRFEDPFDIKNFNDDKNEKNWDDYMTSTSYIPAYSPSAGNVQSATDRVFDGVYAVGKQVPWLGPDARMTVLAGRMGTSPTQTQRWEEAVKIDEPWANNLIRTAVSTEWVNDNFGVNQPQQLDLKDYAADVKVNLAPVFLELNGGLSDFNDGGAYAGPVWTSSSNPNAGTAVTPNYAFLPSFKNIEDGAGQATLIFYPFTLYGFSIGSNYADFQSRVMMSGINFFHYGMSWNPSDFNDAYGEVAEADTLQSDRYGWRFNFGWNGRKQDWMKDWPSFLDDIVVNLDLTQKKEQVAEFDPMGYNVIEPFTMLSFYYPDDEGLWGLDLWGNYAPNVNPLRQDYINNIEAVRNDNDISNDDVRYQFRLSSERLPLILPIYNNGGILSLTPATPGQAIATYATGTSKGLNQYANLTDLKTYNYITLTTKVELNKWVGIKSPIDGTFYITDNQVAGVASAAATNLTGLPSGSTDANGNPNGSTFSANIPNLFQQRVWDAAAMVNVLQNIDLLVDVGQETWKSAYTYPQVDYLTNAFGLGFAYDIPWCSGKLEFRYKHIDFQDNYVSANNYHGDQYFSRIKFLF